LGLPYKGNVLPKPHKVLGLNVVWTEKKSGKVLNERKIYVDKSSGKYFAFDYAPLPSVEYVVTVRALDDDPRCDGTFKVGITVGWPLAK